MAKATLTISSKNYSSWSLRGWLLTKFSGRQFEEIVTAPDDASARAVAAAVRRTLARQGHQAARVDLAVHGTCADCRGGRSHA